MASAQVLQPRSINHAAASPPPPPPAKATSPGGNNKVRILWRGSLLLDDGVPLPGLAIVSTHTPSAATWTSPRPRKRQETDVFGTPVTPVAEPATWQEASSGNAADDAEEQAAESDLTLAIEMLRHAPLSVRTHATCDGQDDDADADDELSCDRWVVSSSTSLSLDSAHWSTIDYLQRVLLPVPAPSSASGHTGGRGAKTEVPPLPRRIKMTIAPPRQDPIPGPAFGLKSSKDGGEASTTAAVAGTKRKMQPAASAFDHLAAQPNDFAIVPVLVETPATTAAASGAGEDATADGKVKRRRTVEPQRVVRLALAQRRRPRAPPPPPPTSGPEAVNELSADTNGPLGLGTTATTSTTTPTSAAAAAPTPTKERGLSATKKRMALAARSRSAAALVVASNSLSSSTSTSATAAPSQAGSSTGGTALAASTATGLGAAFAESQSTQPSSVAAANPTSSSMAAPPLPAPASALASGLPPPLRTQLRQQIKRLTRHALLARGMVETSLSGVPSHSVSSSSGVAGPGAAAAAPGKGRGSEAQGGQLGTVTVHGQGQGQGQGGASDENEYARCLRAVLAAAESALRPELEALLSGAATAGMGMGMGTGTNPPGATTTLPIEAPRIAAVVQAYVQLYAPPLPRALGPGALP